MKKLINIQNLNLIIFLFSLIAISFALILQYFFDLAPCELCIFQRIPYYIIIFVFLFKIFFKVKEYFITTIIFLCLIFEFGFSTYHTLVSIGIIELESCSRSVNLPNNIDSLKNALENNTLIIDCKESNKQIFGIYLSAYNVFTSIIFLLSISINAFKKK